MENEQSYFQDLDFFQRTKRLKEDDINFKIQKYSSNSETREILPNIYEISVKVNFLDILVKANVSFDVITMKSQLERNNISLFNK